MNRTLPERIDRDHPLVRKEYAIFTPPIDEMIDTMRDWIERRIPGGYIYGASRFGKSRGVKFFVRQELKATFGSTIPLVVWIRPTDTDKSEAGFWHELLYYSGFEFTNPIKPHSAVTGRYLVKERFITIARESRSNYIVLIIDEAQEVTYKEWKWLTGLQNKLDWDGFRLSVFSVGTQQLGYKHSLLGKSGNAHVAARFMVENARFHGLCSVEDLHFVLRGYDEDSEWPKGSGITYHQYYSPEGFARGERLAETADFMWAALREIDPNAKEYPMQNIAFAVEGTLNKLAMDGDWDQLTSQSGWKEALEQTSLRRHMTIVATAG